MLKLKPWQFVFLGYLLVLNIVAFTTIAYFLINRTLWRAQPKPIDVAAVKPFPSANLPDTLADTPAPDQISDQPARPPLSEMTTPVTLATLTPIPAIHIPPKSIPTRSGTTMTGTASVTNIAPAIPAAQDQSTPTQPPSATPGATRTPTRISSPTPIPTATPSPTTTSTPLPTLTATRTPTPTRTNTPAPTVTPIPTATGTATRTPSPSPTKTPRPSPTLTTTPRLTATSRPTAAVTRTPTIAVRPTVTALAIAALSAREPLKEPAIPSSARPAEPDQQPAGGLDLNAVPLTNGSIALSWTPSDPTRPYRIYSDMGTGYGVYVYKARTTEPAYLDELLRSGMAYTYRITQMEDDREVVLAQAGTTTFGQRVSAGDGPARQTPASVADSAPAPTALPPDAVLLGLVSDNNFTDNFNTLTIAGEVRNDSNLDVGHTDITVTFYDTTGTIISTATGETLLDILPPGETSPFLITLTQPEGLASYSLRAVARPVTPKLSAQLVVVEVRRFEDEAGFFHVKGVVENVGSTVAKRTKVAAIIYGRDRGVINVGFTYVTPPTLAPGEQAAYDVIFTYYPRYLTQRVIPFEE